MARDRSGGCDTGRTTYRTKAEAEKANPGVPVERCARCRQWHAMEKRGRRARGRTRR